MHGSSQGNMLIYYCFPIHFCMFITIFFYCVRIVVGKKRIYEKFLPRY
jgi:hypothetical protein